MATFNPTDAVVYGLTSLLFEGLFAPSAGAYQSSEIYNSFSTVYPFTSTSFPAGNAQAIRNLYPSINSGPDIGFTIKQIDTSDTSK